MRKKKNKFMKLCTDASHTNEINNILANELLYNYIIKTKEKLSKE